MYVIYRIALKCVMLKVYKANGIEFPDNECNINVDKRDKK